MYYFEKYSMSVQGTEDFKKEIIKMKNKYADQIEVYLGLEFDMFSNTHQVGYDYMLGSCRYIKLGMNLLVLIGQKNIMIK